MFDLILFSVFMIAVVGVMGSLLGIMYIDNIGESMKEHDKRRNDKKAAILYNELKL
jgi:hypothetical protein